MRRAITAAVLLKSLRKGALERVIAPCTGATDWHMRPLWRVGLFGIAAIKVGTR